jgi:hypothetical protein
MGKELVSHISTERASNHLKEGIRRGKIEYNITLETKGV